MTQLVTIQLKLREAFRYAYFAFEAIIAAVLILLAIGVLDGGVASAIAESWPHVAFPLMAALALGLSVPLFFACWLLAVSAILGPGTRQSSYMDGVQDYSGPSS